MDTLLVIQKRKRIIQYRSTFVYQAGTPTGEKRVEFGLPFMGTRNTSTTSRRTPMRDLITRRSMLAGTAVAAAGIATVASNEAANAGDSNTAVKTYTSEEFYDANGKFLVDKAREAYFDMFRRFGYPISKKLQKEMWVLDFGLGDFAHVGMAGIFWLNRQDYGYFGHEIFLLPGQMIAEHSHVPTPKGPAKMESWHPRRGMIYTFGEGEPTSEYIDKIPASQRALVKSRHCKPLQIDDLGDLNRLEAWHFMVAGPEGALVTEYGTFHDMDGLKFSNPKAKL
jgi:D-lyxose ketol-isomerase